ncbi:MAG TPA: sugar ABC transporter permease [Acidimicrobiales bacterium]|nr:sugar ABC transporter permease [Acidimicrobiales bacterium]
MAQTQALAIGTSRDGARRRGGSIRTRRAVTAYAFLAPAMSILFVFVIWPIIDVFWQSLHNTTFLPPASAYSGLTNFRGLFDDPQFWTDLRTTAIYTVVTVPLTMAAALAAALGLRRNNLASRMLRTVYFLPALSSLAVMGLIWGYLLTPNIGVLDYWLHGLGISQPDWLGTTTWALPSVIAVGVWVSLGYDMVIFVAGRQGIPEEYYEAARIDGATGWQQFRHVTLPLLAPTTMFVLVTSVIGAFQAFDQIYVMTTGGPLYSTETLVIYMYRYAFENFEIGYGCAVAVVLFVIVLAFTAVEVRMFRRSQTRVY